MLKSGGIDLNFHQHCVRVSSVQNSCQYLPDFIILAILVPIQWYLTVALIYISLTINGVEYLFINNDH